MAAHSTSCQISFCDLRDIEIQCRAINYYLYHVVHMLILFSSVVQPHSGSEVSMGDQQQPITNECPYCRAAMAVTQMACGHCHVSVSAVFPMSRLAGLPVEHQRFIEMFVLAGGNLKEIAEQVGVSYPTIRSRLDKVIESLRGEIAKTQRVRGNLLDAVDPGKTNAAEAARLIKRI
jgi:hypothetical protein